jgi:hypothetical protein
MAPSVERYVSSLKRLVVEVHRRSLWQVLGIYVGRAWFSTDSIDDNPSVGDFG